MKRKVKISDFADWLGLESEDIRTAKAIVDVSDADGAYTHLEDMGEYEAANAVQLIWFEYGSLEGALKAYKEETDEDESQVDKLNEAVKKYRRLALKEQIRKVIKEIDHERQWKDFVLDNIKLDDYEDVDENKPLESLMSIIKKEVPYDIKKMGKLGGIKKWLNSVPGAIDIPLSNKEIRDLTYAFGHDNAKDGDMEEVKDVFLTSIANVILGGD